MITEKVPEDWHALQVDVAKILEECGFTVEVDRKTDMVRGQIDIDVYALEVHHGRSMITLFECKHWKRAVPQTIVHAFQTTVAGVGANVGYIVGSSGFQPGAFEAAKMTNIRLLTWEQFQEEFQQQWLEVHILPHFHERVESFLRWTEPLPPTRGRPLTSEEEAAFWALWRSYLPLSTLMNLFTPWFRFLRSNPVPTLPLRDADPWGRAGLPEDVLEARGYRELFDLLAKHGEEGAEALRLAAHADEE